MYFQVLFRFTLRRQHLLHRSINKASLLEAKKTISKISCCKR